MDTEKQKFASQADALVLESMRQIAADEGKQLQAVLDEAMRDFIAKKRGEKPRSHMLEALNESILDFGDLYQQLAK